MNIDYDQFMKIAFEEAKASLREGNHGFGAVVVSEGMIIAKAHDQEESEADPTSHAELDAIRLASQRLGKNLEGCLLVATHEPCPMCTTAAIWAGIKDVSFGYSIPEAIAEGRERINLTCQEIFARAGITVTVHAGVMHEQCSMLYRKDVRKEVDKLRGATPIDLERLRKEFTTKRLCWYEETKGALKIDQSNPAMAGYELLLDKLGIDFDEAPVVERTENRVIFHSKNFCPTLEACRLLDLDTRHVCRLMTEGPADALVKQLNGNLAFSRNYAKIRPYREYCEEIVTLNS